MTARSTGLILAIALGASQLLPLNVALAQRVQTAAPADGSVLPFPPVPSASVAAPRLQDSKHQRRPEQSHLRKDAPNVLIILMDDVGFGQPSTFGGEINTPTLSKLADQGISYNTFHTTSICSPTRAALLTGRNHQRVGNGTIAERAVDWDGYSGVIPKTSATIAEVLRDYGYKTARSESGTILPPIRPPRWARSTAGRPGMASITSMVFSPARRRSGNRGWWKIPTRSNRRTTRNTI
jgi:hypothetical protein